MQQQLFRTDIRVGEVAIASRIWNNNKNYSFMSLAANECVSNWRGRKLCQPWLHWWLSRRNCGNMDGLIQIHTVNITEITGKIQVTRQAGGWVHGENRWRWECNSGKKIRRYTRPPHNHYAVASACIFSVISKPTFNEDTVRDGRRKELN